MPYENYNLLRVAKNETYSYREFRIKFYYWIEPESAPCEGAVLTVIRYKQMFFKNYSNFARIVFIYTTNFTRMFLKVLESSFHRKITCWLAR